MNENTFSFAMRAAYFRKFICKDINLKANHNILRKIIRFFCRFPYVKEIKKIELLFAKSVAVYFNISSI